MANRITIPAGLLNHFPAGGSLSPKQVTKSSHEIFDMIKQGKIEQVIDLVKSDPTLLALKNTVRANYSHHLHLM